MSTASQAVEQQAAVDVQRLNKRLGGRLILEQVNFQVPNKCICGLLGPNGAGKTTLLRCMTGSLNADFGRCLINGKDSSYDASVYQEFGFSPDIPTLEPALRVEEYLSLHAHLRGIPKALITERIDSCLEKVKLSDRKRFLISALSRGQSSRLALAEALLHNPAVLFLDEPTAGLDPAQVVNQRALLEDLAKEHCVIVATHNLAEAQAICNQLVVLIQGRIRFQGSVEDLAAGEELEKAYLKLAGHGA